MPRYVRTLEITILQLFYSKRSQFVSGVEAEKVSVSVGQRVSEILVVPYPCLI